MWTYLAFTMITTLGFATFGVLAFHLAARHVLPIAAIPVVYAAAMGIDALAVLATGLLYDRIGRRALIIVPILSAGIPALAFTTTPALAITGVLVWGAVLGIQESTMRAAVADLVPPPAEAPPTASSPPDSGTATLAGGLLAGALYDRSIPALITTVATIQVLALAGLLLTPRGRRPTPMDPRTRRG